MSRPKSQPTTATRAPIPISFSFLAIFAMISFSTSRASFSNLPQLVPAGLPVTSLRSAVMTGPEADKNDRSLHPGQKRDQMVLQSRTDLPTATAKGPPSPLLNGPKLAADAPFPSQLRPSEALGAHCDRNLPRHRPNLSVSAGGTAAATRRVSAHSARFQDRNVTSARMETAPRNGGSVTECSPRR